MGESMGAAVLMCLATAPRSAAGGRLRAGRAGGVGPRGDERVPAQRRCGWSSNLVPGMTLTGAAS